GGADGGRGVAISLARGGGRVTRGWLVRDPPSADEVRQLRKHVRAEIAGTAGSVMRDGRPHHAVATSKTFRQLARIAGAAPSSDGPYVRRILHHADVTALTERLSRTPAPARGQPPGVPRRGAPPPAPGPLG